MLRTCFLFSSRRRHTRLQGDWSSDVCSSDLRRARGDVTDAEHRRALVDAAGSRIDLLVNNASALGPSPMPALAEYPLPELAKVFDINVLAPLALFQIALPRLSPGATVVNVTSDAAVEPYERWGGYGAS